MYDENVALSITPLYNHCNHYLGELCIQDPCKRDSDVANLFHTFVDFKL